MTLLDKILVVLLVVSSLPVDAQKQKSSPVYYPEQNNWLSKAPAAAGMSADKLLARDCAVSLILFL